MKTGFDTRGRLAAAALAMFMLLLAAAWTTCRPVPQPAKAGYGMAAVHQSMEPQSLSFGNDGAGCTLRAPLPESPSPAGVSGAVWDAAFLFSSVFAGCVPAAACRLGAATPVRLRVRLDE